MADFNYISGSSIDNSINTLFRLFESNDCYMGFSRGKNISQWSIYTLVNVEQAPGINFPTNVIAVSGSAVDEEIFYDFNSVKITGASDDKRLIKIVKYLKTDTDFGDAKLVSGADGNLKLCNLNTDWAVIEGLERNFISYQQNLPDYDLWEYYILPAVENEQAFTYEIQLKINKRSMTSTPFYNNRVQLSMDGDIVYTGLEKETNMLGETFVKGVIDPLNGNAPVLFSDSMSGNTLLYSSTFNLIDEQSSDIIIEGMTLVQPSNYVNTIYSEGSFNSGLEKFFTMKYTNVQGREQHINFLIRERNSDALAMWNEQLPYDTLSDTSDNNPPSLDVTYLKNPMFNSSIFDVNGLSKITNSEVKFVKQIFSVADKNYYTSKGFTIENIELNGSSVKHTGTVRVSAEQKDTTIQLYGDHDFVIGDKFTLASSPVGFEYTIEGISYENSDSLIELNDPLIFNPGLSLDQYDVITSNETTVNSNFSFATTTNKDLALRYNCVNVMITKNIPLVGSNSPTENVYRQLFISYKPRTGDEGQTDTFCTENIYSGDTKNHGANFNINKWVYDNGLILYLANKITMYRKWSNSDEEFKIIL